MSLYSEPGFWDSVRAISATLDRCADQPGGLVTLSISDVKRVIAVVDVPFSAHLDTIQRARDYDAVVRLLGDAMRHGGVKP